MTTDAERRAARREYMQWRKSIMTPEERRAIRQDYARQVAQALAIGVPLMVVASVLGCTAREDADEAAPPSTAPAPSVSAGSVAPRAWRTGCGRTR